jgi:hypothetical protein
MPAGANVNCFCLAWETLGGGERGGGGGEWEELLTPAVRTRMPRVIGWYASCMLVYPAFGEP